MDQPDDDTGFCSDPSPESNRPNLTGAVVVDIMRTHPMVIIGGILQENPFFVPPDEFPRELRERRATRVK